MSKWYVPVKHKFFISLGGACLYMTICLFIGIPWFHDLSAVVGEVLAVLIIGGVGLVPGFINLLLVISSLLNKQKYNINTNPLKPITVLIAAYNEEE
ncbi:MAG: glycosyltransferase family 2 protein, partial [Anaerovoracaceae bacterium]